MNCYDCATQGLEHRSVAVCRRCGAGVCAECVQTRDRTLDQHGTVGSPHPGETRTMLCMSCAKTLIDHTLAPSL